MVQLLTGLYFTFLLLFFFFSAELGFYRVYSVDIRMICIEYTLVFPYCSTKTGVALGDESYCWSIIIIIIIIIIFLHLDGELPQFLVPFVS